MVEFIGLLKVKVVKGINLAVRDMLSSDPYVVLKLGHQVNYHYLSFEFTVKKLLQPHSRHHQHVILSTLSSTYKISYIAMLISKYTSPD